MTSKVFVADSARKGVGNLLNRIASIVDIKLTNATAVSLKKRGMRMRLMTADFTVQWLLANGVGCAVAIKHLFF